MQNHSHLEEKTMKTCTDCGEKRTVGPTGQCHPCETAMEANTEPEPQLEATCEYCDFPAAAWSEEDEAFICAACVDPSCTA